MFELILENDENGIVLLLLFNNDVLLLLLFNNEVVLV